MMLSDNMGDNLRMYYAWASEQDPADIGYPHSDPVRHLRGGGIGCEGLSDDEAMHIDRALGILKQAHPQDALIARMVHRDRRSFRWLEKRGYGERRAIASQLSGVHDFLRGFLAAHEAA